MKDTLHRMRLRRKYSCVVIPATKENVGMINKIKDFVAYGEISADAFEKLKNKRGEKDPSGKGLKPFFRLHPPRGGANTKVHFPKGILGNNKEKINDLLERML